MVKDLMYSLVEIERFLLDHHAEESVSGAFRDVRDAVYSYQIKTVGLGAGRLQSTAASSKSSKCRARSPTESFAHTFLCGCLPQDNTSEDDAITTESCSSERKDCDVNHPLLPSPRPRRGWLIGPSRRNLFVNYDSVEEYEKLVSQLGNNWNMDLLALSNFKAFTQNGPIITVGRVLIHPVGERIHPDFNRLLAPIISMLQDVYLPNPYHNALHGACVAHMMAVLAKTLKLRDYVTPHEEFAYLIAALGHDAGHPGKTNAFLRSTQNPLALIYNDASILENYHASLICHIIRSQEDFFRLFTQQQWEAVRTRIIQLVLATDMMSHFKHINNVKERRLNGTLDYKNNPEDLWLLLVLCIKTADIGHNFLPWCEHLSWTKSLFEEFHMQGDEERLLSIPLLLFFDRTRSCDIADSQLGFFEGLTTPLIDELALVDANNVYFDRFIRENARANLEQWKKNSKRRLEDIVQDLEESDEVHRIPDATIA
ncbi:3'5'-cyclic nucleotide phosphodiesterase, putative [Babesia caballi]|uniref:3'5'-cyclic nucleotide phosphodiesterase, putative n=1 Tax=Babesia caballi TaxID=5871 RepID=A0AAV4LSS8_BABCB|nr:3'5'-cyclic nucleotide phosphodiesterase, putative [Babesia caballi]